MEASKGIQTTFLEPVGQTIPFGKYKGQPVEILLTDPDYVTWIRATMGEKLKAQYPLVLNYIVAHYGEPERTPDHNALQKRFLKRDFQLRFALAVCPSMANWVTLSALDLDNIIEDHFSRQETNKVKLEQDSFTRRIHHKDLTLDSIFEGIRDEIQAEKTAWRQNARMWFYTGRLNGDILEQPVTVSHLKFEERGSDVVYGVTHSWSFALPDRQSPECSGDSIAGCRECMEMTVQIKPILGDDYPAVLRAMKAVKTKHLLVREYTGIGASWDEVQQVFGLDSIQAVLLDNVERIQIPEEFERVRVPAFNSGKVIT